MSQPALNLTNALPTHQSGGKELRRTSTRGSNRARAGKPNVLSRLQSLFPSTPSSPRASAAGAPAIVNAEQIYTRPPPRALKVHVVSWNMHDSLPKGNLEDLLGAVPPYVPCPESETDRFRVPNMSMEDCHPYHFVVVAGQECPTVSGIPMGIGASFKHKEKEKYKDGEKSSKKGRGKEGKDKDKDDFFEIESSLANTPPPLSPAGDTHSMAGSHGPTSGWSWILEEWYCHGLGQRDAQAGTSSASELYNSQATSADASIGSEGQLNSMHDGDPNYEHDASCAKAKEKKKKDGERKRKSCLCNDKKQIGPYELLVKERLMGIYVAVFIYRDLKPLVRGISKSAVSTGLIGGRVGNKGGVGISVNLDGTSLLFVNAHLAAHEERVMSRVANFTKIKSELQVNDFLSQDDPRVMSEDLTDKFDYTFLFGDLNFRLDVTRLHADWLISRQDYKQALTFDQLRTLMIKGQAFVGFNEASISFPPTFKYDVMKSLKRDRSMLSRELGLMRGGKRWLGQRSNPNLSEVQETDAELTARLAEEERGASMEAEDNGSFVSTVVTGTSMQSRMTVNGGDSDDNDGFFDISKSRRSSNKSKSEDDGGAIDTVQKLFIAKAALKAKAKWLSMVKPQVHTRPPHPRSTSKKSLRSEFSASSSPRKTRAVRSASTSSPFRGASSAIELGRSCAPGFVELQRTPSKRSTKSAKSVNVLGSAKVVENAVQEKECGVYDTSSKQRVPSWCDRILWKTTVQPEPESENEDESIIEDQPNNGLGPRMLAFLSQALRPLSARTRTASFSSVSSLPIVEIPPTPPTKGAPHSAATTPSSQTPIARKPEVSEKERALVKVKSLVNVRHRPMRKARSPKLLKSRSIEPTSTTPLVPPSFQKRRSRAYTTMPVISAPVVSLPLPVDAMLSTESETTAVPDTPRISNKDSAGARQRTTSSRGWRILTFFNRVSDLDEHLLVSNSAQSMEAQEQEEIASLPPPPKRPRRGQVIALGYNSLDDQAMRRLEGRSDHRPVIGSYAVYI